MLREDRQKGEARKEVGCRDYLKKKDTEDSKYALTDFVIGSLLSYNVKLATKKYYAAWYYAWFRKF